MVAYLECLLFDGVYLARARAVGRHNPGLRDAWFRGG